MIRPITFAIKTIQPFEATETLTIDENGDAWLHVQSSSNVDQFDTVGTFSTTLSAQQMLDLSIILEKIDNLPTQQPAIPSGTPTITATLGDGTTQTLFSGEEGTVRHDSATFVYALRSVLVENPLAIVRLFVEQKPNGRYFLVAENVGSQATNFLLLPNTLAIFDSEMRLEWKNNDGKLNGFIIGFGKLLDGIRVPAILEPQQTARLMLPFKSDDAFVAVYGRVEGVISMVGPEGEPDSFPATTVKWLFDVPQLP